MSVVIRIVTPVVGGPSNLDGTYVKRYDPNARGGRGAVEGTHDPRKAMQFEDGGKAFAFWRQTSTVLPKRPDGRPNRPLTAFTVEFMPSVGVGNGGTG